MRRHTIWILTVALAAGLAPARAEERGGAPDDSYTGELAITRVEIERMPCPLEDLKHGGEVPDPALASPGQLMNDAYTVSSGGVSEAYSFAGGTGSVIDHKVSFCVLTGAVMNFGYAWQPCGSGAVFPPLPMLLGTVIDGNPIGISLPAPGCYLLTVGVSGFGPGEWDWMVLADYAGSGPIVPLSPDVDTFGGSKTTYALYDGAGDGVGAGASSARPWCFRVTP